MTTGWRADCLGCVTLNLTARQDKALMGHARLNRCDNTSDYIPKKADCCKARIVWLLERDKSVS